MPTQFVDRHISDLKTNEHCADCGVALYKGLNWYASDDLVREDKDGSIITVPICTHCSEKRDQKIRTIMLLASPIWLPLLPILWTLYLLLGFAQKIFKV